MKKNPILLIVTSFILFSFHTVTIAQKNNTATESTINALIKKLTLEEKISMLHANSIFTTNGVERLNIPGLSTDDGPLGIREDLSPSGGWASANLTTDSATFFPNGSALAATWNPSLANRYGIAIGEEARARNKNILLAPAFNIARTPLCGRTYEYYSEDPFLNAQLAVAATKGIQSQHVAACVKHYALNNQETDRGRVNVEVSERALREIYLPAFKASIIEGDAWTIMSAYNKVRGEYCSENDYLLNTILKGEWGFKGIVISDWGGTHSTVNAANKGLDVEMGSRPPYENYYFAKPLLDSVKAGKVNEKTIDEKVRRILRVIYKTSLSNNLPAGSLNTPAHSQTVYDIAAESIVLLKNEKHLLPLDKDHIKTIAVIGDNAIHKFQAEGFGAGVKAKYEITALAGLQNVFGNSVAIQFAKGYNAPKTDRKNKNEDVNKPDSALIAEAVTIAKNSDIAIVFIGGNRDYESESRDRKDLSLPFGEQALVDAVTAANDNTIVVVTGGAPYDLNKIKKNNHTIVFSWYNGSEGGNALADVLTGKVNPSGKLPFTFPVALEESPAHYLKSFPGDNLETNYKEGILVGYRWYDTKNITPLYPFGYGLSYTNFDYSDFHTSKKSYTINETITADITIKNTGETDGRETVQLYISKQGSAIERADKELKAFKKIMIPAGEEVTVTLTIPVKDLAYYNEQSRQWVVEPGRYILLAGTSSKDIKATEAISISGGK
jgi:beta-glucosidase